MNRITVSENLAKEHPRRNQHGLLTSGRMLKYTGYCIIQTKVSVRYNFTPIRLPKIL